MSEPFPRLLTAVERELLMWVLPEDRPGYAEVRRSIDLMSVVAVGRRGEGNIILGEEGHVADIESPLPSVLAFGMFIGPRGVGSVTVHEPFADQIEVEIVDARSSEVARRWTYSTWNAGDACPQCGGSPRVVQMNTEAGRHVTLAICPTDRRIWVLEEKTGFCRPIPVTLFHSELMRRSGVRKPDAAFQIGRFFETLADFPDETLTAAFAAYNRIRSKVDTGDPIRLQSPRRSFWRRLFTFIRP